MHTNKHTKITYEHTRTHTHTTTDQNLDSHFLTTVTLVFPPVCSLTVPRAVTDLLASTAQFKLLFTQVLRPLAGSTLPQLQSCLHVGWNQTGEVGHLPLVQPGVRVEHLTDTAKYR